MERVCCPHCNFSKPVNFASIPDRVKVKCPKCFEFFHFIKPVAATGDTIELAFEQPVTRPVAAPVTATMYEEPQPCRSVEIPDAVLKKIKNGWIAAIISGVLTLGVVLLAVSIGVLDNLFDLWSLIDVALVFGLAFGIYKKSRVAATTMLVYFLASKIWMIAQTGKPSGIVMAVIFLYYYFQAMVGTFQYHKLKS